MQRQVDHADKRAEAKEKSARALERSLREQGAALLAGRERSAGLEQARRSGAFGGHLLT